MRTCFSPISRSMASFPRWYRSLRYLKSIEAWMLEDTTIEAVTAKKVQVGKLWVFCSILTNEDLLLKTRKHKYTCDQFGTQWWHITIACGPGMACLPANMSLLAAHSANFTISRWHSSSVCCQVVFSSCACSLRRWWEDSQERSIPGNPFIKVPNNIRNSKKMFIPHAASGLLGSICSSLVLLEDHDWRWLANRYVDSTQPLFECMISRSNLYMYL